MDNEKFAERFVREFGPEKVLSDDASLSHYAASIDGSFCKPAAIVFPTSESEVIRLVQLANELDFALFPISKGKNLGYGDAQGTTAGQVIVDLRRMNQILEVNDELCFVTIQPGVSQQQLYEFIKNNGHRLQLDVTGAGLEASIVGNILERGFGHTDYGDRFSRIITMNVVLPGGGLIKTGFAGFKNGDATKTYRHGIGPVLDGLFSQSNFGIVTEMTIEMMPVPEKVYMFAVSVPDENALPGIIDAVRELKLKGIVQSAIHIANKSRTVGSRKNPFVGVWNLSGCIVGPASLVRTKKKIIRKTFRKHLKKHLLVFIGKRLVWLLHFVDTKLFKLSFYPPIREVFAEQNGIPTDDPIRTLLDDETINTSTLSVEKYDYCFGWINAVCRAEAKSVNACITLLENLFTAHGYEFRITMTAVNPRTLILISNITYRREVDAIAKGKEFIRICHEALNDNGFLPYRSGSGNYHELPEYEAVYKQLLLSLKQIVDPKKIMAPGKYNIS